MLATTIICGATLSTAVVGQQAVASTPVTAPEREPVQMDAVVVTGKVTGPGMWQVYMDDDHDLWILGTLSPLPANIEWDSSQVQDLVAQAGDVMWGPNYSVNIKANYLQQAMLGLSYLKAQKNPDGKSLQQVLDPALYARWQVAKARYMPRNSSVEKKRPLVAAQDLLDAAIKRVSLSGKDIVSPQMKRFAKESGIRNWRPVFTVDVSNKAAKAALSDVRRLSLDDSRCLAATLDAIDDDIPRMVANANAWAKGDVQSISFSALARRESLCSDAMMSPEFSAKYGLPHIEKSVADHWLKHARAALNRNAITVAFVPMEYLVGPNNYLNRLRAEGYTVSSP
ncbi:MAG: TraB/GumN family protein [Luteimonas sp.]